MSEISLNDVVIAQAGIEPGTPVHRALEGRADVMEMTQATHDAALKPNDPGGLSHELRAALAARIARLNGDEALAEHYDGLVEDAGATEEITDIADPRAPAPPDGWLAAVVAYTDLVAARPRDTQTGDIEVLKAAGVSDADIVRLSELNAFLAYQIRVIAGLKLMRGAK